MLVRLSQGQCNFRFVCLNALDNCLSSGSPSRSGSLLARPVVADPNAITVQTNQLVQKAIFLLLCCVLISLSAGQLPFQSGTNRTALLELFTSEGCSSCPPAEAWLSRLKSDARLWKDFVPVAFHVDYWDYLGWRDSFGTADYSERQRAYAAHWKSRSVYTPGFVLDGKEWRGWFSRDELPRVSNQPTGKLTASSDNGKGWLLRFEPIAANSSAVDFHAALLGFDLNSDVKTGENRGRKLQHDFVVLTLVTATSKRGSDSFQTDLTLTPPSHLSAKRLGVAVWVTRHGDLQPLQAIGGWLPENSLQPTQQTPRTK